MAATRPDPRQRTQGAFCASRTRLVNALKVVLPLGALVLLSTMFMISDKVDPDAAIPYAEVDVEALTHEPRLTSPTYAGTTRDGTALTMRAGRAVPGEGGAIRAEGVSLQVQTPEGLSADLRAGSGGVAAGGKQIDLSGGVLVSTSTGYNLRTEQIAAETADGRLIAPGPVTAMAPFGQIEAGAMALSRPDGGQAHVLDFTGGVRLLYQPQR